MVLPDMIDNAGFDDHRLKFIAQQRTVMNNSAIIQKDISKEVIRRLRIQNKKLIDRLGASKSKIEAMKSEKTQLHEKFNEINRLNVSLSKALGSCPVCWGGDDKCPTCLGNGIPGWAIVNKRFFNTYILPCVESLYGLGAISQTK